MSVRSFAPPQTDLETPSMKVALVYPVRVAGAHRFGWRWRAELTAEESSGAFAFFYDCVKAAQHAGYECKFVRGDVSSVPRQETASRQVEGAVPLTGRGRAS